VSTTNVVNPGTVNVADQAQAPFSINQTVTVGPSTDSGPVVQVVGQSGRPSTVEQAIKVGPSSNPGPVSQAAVLAPGTGVTNAASRVTPPMTAGLTVQAGLASPTSVHVVNTALNTTAGQVYGSGSPTNVYK